jgi:dolichyl-phosphate-mannose-protein mannosyltransferase
MEGLLAPPVDVAPRRLRARLVPPFVGSPALGWVGPLLVTALAGWLRFDRLSIPSALVFDENYYAHDSWSLLHHGVELNKNFTSPEFIVHPPLAKWMIAIGEAIFGNNSTGWRFSAAVVGTLAVLIVARTARRMTRSTLLGCIAGLLMCLDGLELVQSRTGMLDIFLTFWVVVSFACLICDRDQLRNRLASKGNLDDTLTTTGIRWWLVGCALAAGCACACKWDGLYYLISFALLAGVWSMGARRAVGTRRPFLSTLRHDVGPITALMVTIPGVLYVASWTGWFVTHDGWDRDWANHRSSAVSFVPAVVRSWWHYHWQIWHFHKTLDTYHPYRSNGWGWLFLTRPVLFFADYPAKGQLGCTSGRGCARMVYSMGNPAIWWVSIPVMVFMAYLVLRRDWRAGAVLLPFVLGLVPWLLTFKRTMFSFYALPLLPFLCIAIAVTAGYLLVPDDGGPSRRAVGATVTGAYLLIFVALFFYFLPILTSQTIPFLDWSHHMWFQSWGEVNGS